MKTQESKKTPQEWCRELGVQIMDPDGWRSKCGVFEPKSFDEPITKHEFRVREGVSTVRLKPYAQLGTKIHTDIAKAIDATADLPMLSLSFKKGSTLDKKQKSAIRKVFNKLRKEIETRIIMESTLTNYETDTCKL